MGSHSLNEKVVLNDRAKKVKPAAINTLRASELDLRQFWQQGFDWRIPNSTFLCAEIRRL